MIDHTHGGKSDTAPRPEKRRDTTGSSAENPDGAMRALSYVLSGILIYGGLGWVIDRVWHQSWGLPVGLILGMGLSVYLIIRRFGRQQ